MESPTKLERIPILVVDDDSALSRTLSDILSLHGYAPMTAGTAREGLRLAEGEVPVLAVVDLRLPDMDGMELVARLHALSELTEVVVLTGNASVESAVAALREHSVDYLLKPVKVDQLLHVVSVANERWQRRHAEERLRDSDERFRRVVESDMIGIMFWEMDGTIYDANTLFLQMMGYEREDLEAGRLNWHEMTPAEYADVDRTKLASLRENEVIAPYEKKFLTNDGHRLPVLFGAATLKGAQDRCVSFVLDITDRKNAERALRSRARQQTAVAELGQHALATTNIADLLDEAVALVAATLEVPLTSVFERRSDNGSFLLCAGSGWRADHVGQLIIGIDGSRQAGHTLLNNEPLILSGGNVASRITPEAEFLSHDARDGITVVIPGPVRPYGVLTAHDSGPREFTRDDVHFMQAVAHVLGTSVEKTRADTTMRQTQRLEAVGRLASGISHDFNNLLAAIMGFGELVQSSLAPSSPLREDVGEILKAASRAAVLTKQLLAFSRQQVMETQTVSMTKVIVDMENMLRRLIGPEINFTTSFARDLGLVKADPGQLEQVVLNLCVNARDAMPDGGTLTIETMNVILDEAQAQAHGMDVKGEYVLLAVSDTGTGMDAETKARIFEPFFSTKASDKGTGLGLATVYGIVKQSGGESWVYSEVGHGTTFKIFLPRVQEENDGDGATVTMQVKLGGETILVAEDDEMFAHIAERLLTEAGYRVLRGKNGTDAIRMSEEHAGTIDLLVTDLIMPGASGLNVFEQVRLKRPEIRVIMVSGFTEATIPAEVALPAGMPLVQKPYAGQSLLRQVREVLDGPSQNLVS